MTEEEHIRKLPDGNYTLHMFGHQIKVKLKDAYINEDDYNDENRFRM